MTIAKKRVPAKKRAARARKTTAVEAVENALTGMFFVLVDPPGTSTSMVIRGPASSAAAACQMNARRVLVQPFTTTTRPPCSGDPVCQFL